MCNEENEAETKRSAEQTTDRANSENSFRHSEKMNSKPWLKLTVRFELTL